MVRRIIRVFPRRTKATPSDDLVRINEPPGFFDDAEEIHISVAFTWDIQRAEELAYQWDRVAKVKVGGPAMNSMGEDFIPGMYTKKGYVITSRGCPNKCWFCSVWRREGNAIRELPITEGYNLLDDNILACSDDHIKRVFNMLEVGKKKYKKPVEFTGGLEAALLKPWHCEEIYKLKPKQLFFAYDTPDDLEPLINSGDMLSTAGFRIHHQLRAYVLCGYPKDTFEQAEKRMYQTIQAGFMPMAMLYRDADGIMSRDWMRWQRQWTRPALMRRKINEAA